MSRKNTEIVVSLEYLRGLQTDHLEAEVAVREAQKKVVSIYRRIRAVAELLGLNPDDLPALPEEPKEPAVKAVKARGPKVAKPPKPPKAKRTKRAPAGGWIKAIIDILEGQNRGLPHAAIFHLLKATPFAKTVNFSLKRYYTTIARMQKNGQVERAGTLTYAPSVAQRLRKGGALPTRDLDHPQMSSNKIQTPNLIRRILIENPKGLEGPDLVGRLSQMDEAPESVRTHPQFVYTTLLNMIRKGSVARVNGIYQLVENGNGPVARTTDPLH